MSVSTCLCVCVCLYVSVRLGRAGGQASGRAGRLGYARNAGDATLQGARVGVGVCGVWVVVWACGCTTAVVCVRVCVCVCLCTQRDFA